MAVTASKKKTRLDFSSMIEDAVPSIEPQAEEAPQEPVQEAPIVEAPAAEEPKVVAPVEEAPKPKKAAAPKKPKKEEPQELVEDDIDALLTSMQSGRGVQKSVYLDEDVYNYIQTKCKKTNAKFSNVLNLLVRSAIKQQGRK